MPDTEQSPYLPSAVLTTRTPLGAAPAAVNKPAWERLRWSALAANHAHKPRQHVQNAQEVYEAGLSPLDRFAVRVTEKVGTMGFFLLILVWTIVWTGYNILASEVPALHWKAFDPFPAFVAYLLISNVIQILLMPLILIGQNLQSRFADTRSQLDFNVNCIAEKEATATLRHLEHQTNLLLLLLKHSNVEIPEEEMRALEASLRLEDELARTDPTQDKALDQTAAALAGVGVKAS